MQRAKSDLRVGFLSYLEPTDKKGFSGTPYQMYQGLRKEFSHVIHLGPIRLNSVDRIRVSLSIFLTKVYHIIRYGVKLRTLHYRLQSRIYGRYFDKRVNEARVDVIFAPVASIEIAYMKTEVPICYHTDATFDQVWGYYHPKKYMTPLVTRMGNNLEQLAINKSNTQIFSSKWAEDHARKYYGASKTSVVKLGANLGSGYNYKPSLRAVDKEFRLLFIAVNWDRKGGGLVFDTFLKLLKEGYEGSLTVCGCIPPVAHEKMTVIPFLDKNKEEDMKEIQRLYMEANIYFMPTRADCTPIVFCEANAYGLPVITTDTGGVSSIIEDEFNGFLLPQEAASYEYVKVIKRLINEDGLYEKLSANAHAKFQEELNWEVWASKVKRILLTMKQDSNRAKS